MLVARIHYRPELLKRTIAFLLAFLFCFTLLYAQKSTSEEKPFIVIMDAGHGGFDVGARGRYSTEKQIALGITLKAGKLIEDIPGVEVKYTRKSDIMPGNKPTTKAGLYYRADFANSNKGNVFISIHANAARNRSAQGTEVYVWGVNKNANKSVTLRENAPLLDDPEYKALFDSSGSAVNTIFWNTVQRSYMQQSLTLANDVENEFEKINRIKRDVKQRQVGIWVLHATAMPSILIETGFITNPEEEDYLNHKQDEIAQAIYMAFINYLAGVKGVTIAQLFGGQGTVPSNTAPEQVNPPVSSNPATAAHSAANANSSSAMPHFKYKIQLMASSKKLSPSDHQFSKLAGKVTRSEVQSGRKQMYRYLLGDYNTFQKATLELKKVHSNGYENAFIVTYKDNVRIDD